MEPRYLIEDEIDNICDKIEDNDAKIIMKNTLKDIKIHPAAIAEFTTLFLAKIEMASDNIGLISATEIHKY